MGKAAVPNSAATTSSGTSSAERDALLAHAHTNAAITEYTSHVVAPQPATPADNREAASSTKERGRHPASRAWCGSRLVLAWVTPLVRLGNRKRLDEDDVWPLRAPSQSSALAQRFAAAYDSTRSLPATFWRMFRGRVALTWLAFAISMACSLVGPLVLRHVLTNLQDREHFVVDNTMLAVGALVASRVLQALADCYAVLGSKLIALEFLAALKAALYAKTIRLSAASRATKSTAEITSMYTADGDSIVAAIHVAHQLWLIPLQIVVVLVLLYVVLEEAALACVGVVLVLLGVNVVLCMAIYRRQLVYRDCKDACMQHVIEVFRAIRAIKLNAVEASFRRAIYLARRRELRALYARRVLVMWSVVLLRGMPVLLNLVAFGVYTLVFQRVLNPTVLFTALSLLQLLQAPLQQIPQVFPALIHAHVGMQHVAAFLALAENDSPPSRKDPQGGRDDEHVLVAIEDGAFGWGHETTTLHGVTLRIQRGGFYVVCGPVGVGKSSLCLALLGEMVRHRGTMAVCASVAYCSQQPWLQHGTVRDNILLGHAYDPAKYERTLAACALDRDLTVLPDGDATVISERAANLSGGQRARIALARACYSDAEMVVLDAPLAAVDAIAQDQIIQNCLLGLLYGRTVVLVTHNVRIIHADPVTHVITVCESGRVVVETRARVPRVVDTESVGPTDSVSTCQCPAPVASDPFHAKNLVPSKRILPGLRTAPVDQRAVETSRVANRVAAAYLRALGGPAVPVVFIASQLAWQGFQIASDFWLSAWVREAALAGRGVPPDEAFAHHELHIAIYGALGLASVAMVFVRAWMVMVFGLRAGRNLFEWMTDALMHAPTRFFDQHAIGRILARYAGDMSVIDNSLPQKFGRLAQALQTVLCGSLIAAVAIQWYGLSLLPLAGMYGWIANLYLQPARDLERLAKRSNAPVLTHLSETVDGGAVVRAFGANHVARFVDTNHAKLDANSQIWYAQLCVSQWFALRIQLVGSAFVVVVTTSLVVLRDTLDPSVIGVAFLYSLSVAQSLEELVQVVTEIEAAMVSPERVHEYTAIELERPHRIASADAPLRGRWPSPGAIEFRAASFRYTATGRFALRELSVEVGAGEKLGIVGRSGAGKSSVLLALFRMNELDAGAIVIDGVDISTLGLATLRESMSIIAQNPVLFKGTLRSNLDPVGCYSDDELWHALRVVGLGDRVATTRLKLESAVDANGDNFSVGESQMVSMAKALLRDARIVVFDEATASVDDATDAALQRAIRTAFASATVLTIAHRLDTIWDYDRVFVMDQGRGVECAAPDVLVDKQSGVFYELMRQGGYLEHFKRFRCGRKTGFGGEAAM